MTATTLFKTQPQPNQSSLGPIKCYSIQLAPGFWKLGAAGTPVDGVAGTGTGAGWAGPGSEFTDLTSANLYINGGTKASPVWKLVTRAG